MIEKGYFKIELDSNEALDIGDLSREDWREVQRRANMVIKSGQTENEKIAFLAGFLNYVAEKQAMKQPFNGQH